MKKEVLEQFASEIIDEKVHLQLITKDGKWYEQESTREFENIEAGKKYFVVWDNNIWYNFQAGKNEDQFMKSFFNQYISKHESKLMILIDGKMVKQGKEKSIAKLKNSDRVKSAFFYTTLYGIGSFIFLSSNAEINTLTGNMGRFLKLKNVAFKNEFSEARWVLRFVINDKVEIHNELLTEYLNVEKSC